MIVEWLFPMRRPSCNGRLATSIASGERLRVGLSSEPGRLVDLITQRLPGGEGAAVVGHDFESTLVEVWPVSRHVSAFSARFFPGRD
jgi:hypothetical protein